MAKKNHGKAAKDAGGVEQPTLSFMPRGGGPKRLVCEVEISFPASWGVFAGVKLTGFALWRGNEEGELYVTFPARAYSTGEARKFYEFVRAQDGTGAALRRLKQFIVDGYRASGGARGGETAPVEPVDAGASDEETPF
jgi:hypothetical protein